MMLASNNLAPKIFMTSRSVVNGSSRVLPRTWNWSFRRCWRRWTTRWRHRSMVALLPRLMDGQRLIDEDHDEMRRMHTEKTSCLTIGKWPGSLARTRQNGSIYGGARSAVVNCTIKCLSVVGKQAAPMHGHLDCTEWTNERVVAVACKHVTSLIHVHRDRRASLIHRIRNIFTVDLGLHVPRTVGPTSFLYILTIIFIYQQLVHVKWNDNTIRGEIKIIIKHKFQKKINDHKRHTGLTLANVFR